MKIEKVKQIRNYVCEGCRTFINKEKVCKAPHKKDGYMCPCSMCIVKMMCESSCDELDYYIGQDSTVIKMSLPGMEWFDRN